MRMSIPISFKCFQKVAFQVDMICLKQSHTFCSFFFSQVCPYTFYNMTSMPVLLYFMTILLRFERYLKTNFPVLFIRYDIFALITLTEIIMTSLIFLIEVDMPNSLFVRVSLKQLYFK